MWDEIEEILISVDVGGDATMAVLDELWGKVRSGCVADGESVFARLKELIAAELSASDDPDARLDDDSVASPYVILVCGVNGSGQEGHPGAADIFRTAAEERLEILGKRAGVDVISHQHGADPGAVAYDAW